MLPSGTVTKAATQQETDEVINQLLNFNILPDDEKEDDITVPIAPQVAQHQ